MKVFLGLGWVVGFKADCLTRDLGLWVECPPGVLRDSSPYLCEVRRKTKENSKQLDGQAAGIEPGTSRQPVLSAEPLSHWWGYFLRFERLLFYIMNSHLVVHRL